MLFQQLCRFYYFLIFSSFQGKGISTQNRKNIPFLAIIFKGLERSAGTRGPIDKDEPDFQIPPCHFTSMQNEDSAATKKRLW